MEQILIRNLPTGTKAALPPHVPSSVTGRLRRRRAMCSLGLWSGEPATIVDLLGTDEGADIEFEPEPWA